MTVPVLSIQNLSKKFRVQKVAGHRSQYGYRTLRDELASLVTWPLRMFRRGEASDGMEDFWALRSINFEVRRGEVVGIVGHNGAGKSTLLKILSRITKPSAGAVVLKGRIGSLLEVGTGFHPELTGRENIYLNGSILGMRRHEIDKKFDAIVDFAEIGPFLDTPVKRYSSGMYVRLAFAVAAHLEPEILIIDEVLAVGDMAFQRKCLGRMSEVGRSGSTILFVSHNMPAVETLCTRAILLDHGQVVMDGGVRPIIQEYHRRVLQTHGETGVALADREGSDRHYKIFRSATLLDEKGDPTNFLPVGKAFHLRIGLDCPVEMEAPTLTVGIDDDMGQRLLSFQNPVTNPVMPRHSQPGAIDCVVQHFPLAPGDYWIKLGISAAATEFDTVERALRITVTDGDLFGSGRGFYRGTCTAPSTPRFSENREREPVIQNPNERLE